MFTGLVEETGEVLSFHAQPESWRLKLRGKLVSEDVQIGDSIAVNGCCLSVTETSKHTLVFDVLEETRLVTNLKDVDLSIPRNKLVVFTGVSARWKIGWPFRYGSRRLCCQDQGDQA